MLECSVTHTERLTMTYLLIQNQGVAPIEGYTLLGMSTSRDVAGAIGQFGSGTKHAINLLLRKGVEFFIYCGKNCLTFYYENVVINDGLGDKQVAKVFCRVTGTTNKTIDCGWVLDFGAMDWTQTSMALREFVSNAIDRTVKGGMTFQEGIRRGHLCVKPDPSKRAKDGYTRIYVRMDCETTAFYDNLGEHFLHFGKAENVGLRFIPKSREHNTGPKIYRQGVLVRQLAGKPSAFDYNFNAGDLKIDESRNSDEFALRANIANVLNQADEATLATLFKLMSDEDLYEAGLDEWYLGYHADEKQQANWQNAWKSANGDALVGTDAESPTTKFAVEKGHSVRVIKSKTFAAVAQKMGVKSVISVLGDVAKEGEVLVNTPEAFEDALDRVWGWIETAHMDRGKDKPRVRAFRDIMQGGAETFGYYKQGGKIIFVREDVGGKLLLKTIMEECAHYVTGATDMSRDFQNYLIDLIVEQATAEVGCGC